MQTSDTKYDPPVISLSQDHQNLCNNTLRSLHDLAPLVDSVEACGVDCTAYKALRSKLLEINTEIKGRFCDNKPLIGM